LGLVLNVEERLAMTHSIQKLLWHENSLSWVSPPHHISLKCLRMGRYALTYKGKWAKRVMLGSVVAKNASFCRDIINENKGATSVPAVLLIAQ